MSLKSGTCPCLGSSGAVCPSSPPRPAERVPAPGAGRPWHPACFWEEMAHVESNTPEPLNQRIHRQTVAHLQQASTSIQDQDLKQYTQQMLSKVKEHQRKGREIAQSVGVDQTTITSLERKAQDSVGGAAASASGTSSESSNSDSSSSSALDSEKKSIE